MIELYKIPAHEAPLEYLNREIAPFDNPNTVVIVPTSRNLRRLLSGKYRDLQTMEEFASRALNTHGAALPDLLRCYYLLKAALELPEEHGRALLKTALPPDEKTFAPLLPFFRELCLEMIDPKKLAQKTQYHEYDREIRALSLLWEGYVKLIGRLGYTDEWALRSSPLFDRAYLNRYNTYIFLSDGYLSNFEMALMESLSAFAKVLVYFNFIGDTHRQEEIFKKRFGKAVAGEERSPLTFSKVGGDLICRNGAADTVLEIVPCTSALSQLNFITSRIMREHFEKGISLDRMAVILPYDGSLPLFLGTDIYKLYNVTSGYTAKELELARILACFVKVLRTKTRHGFSLVELTAATSFAPFLQSTGQTDFFSKFRGKGHLFIDLEELKENAYLGEFMKAFTPFLAEQASYSEAALLVSRFLKTYAPYYDEKMFELCEALEFELAKISAAYAKIETMKPMADILEDLLEILSGISVGRGRRGGVAVMGLLESRHMQYDYIFMPDMNDGLFPRESGSNLFLNSEIRRGLSLPTYADREALQINYCLQLIARAKHVVITYKEGEEEGESRFIMELRAAAGSTDIKKEVDGCELIFSSSRAIKAAEENPEKTPEALKSLRERTYSATALTCYRECPLKFFLKYIRGLKSEALSEEKSAMRLGELLDGTMENAYRRGLTALNETYEGALFEEFEKLAALGSHYLSKTDVGLFHLEALKATLPELAQKDREALLSGPPLRVQKFKEQASCELFMEQLGESARFKGIADRVDYFENGEYRIIDYKYKLTSKLKGALKAEDFEKVECDIQMPLYGLIFTEKLKKSPNGIYWFDMRGGAGLVDALDTALLEEFKIYLRKLMAGILSPGTFCRRHSDSCRYCDFGHICDKW